MIHPQHIQVLIISGSVGVGKTSVAYAISDILKNAGVPHATIDLDQLRHSFPRPKHDPFNMELGYKNLHAVWANYEKAGVTYLIIPNVVENHDELENFRSAIPNADIVIVHLHAKLETVQDRLKKREIGHSLLWHLKRAEELTNQFERLSVGDFTVDTDQKQIDEIAREILEKINWLK